MDKPEGVTQRELIQSRVLLALAALLPMLVLLACGTASAADREPHDPRYQVAGILQQDDFQGELSSWTLESERPAQVTTTGGVLDLNTPAGLTLWFRPELRGPILIEYEAEAVAAGGPNDRVSDLNCFWMATDPGATVGPAGRRSGAFADYNTLRTYYVGLGGNSNTTTRFRRYIGSATDRPLLPENDRSAPQDLLRPNQFQRIRVVADGGLIQYYRDDRKLFEYQDPQPYTRGWFAFRTTQSHLRIRHFRVYRVIPADTYHFSRPELDGNYRVTLQMHGRPPGPTFCTVQAEARRLMTDAFAVPSGELLERTFIVNVRSPALSPPPPNAPGAASVRLGPDELNTPDWDDTLTLDIPGCAALVTNVTVDPVHVPTIYLVGDSTVTDVPQGPGASWGQMLPRFFNPDIAVANHAKSGASLKSFLTELRLDKVLSVLAPGDWLLIQFGHNDQKKQWPQTYVEADTTYRAYLHVYIAEARRRGAIPVLITSPERRNFDQAGKIVDSLEGYPDAVRSLARDESVALIDLNAMSNVFYEALGPERAEFAFRDEGHDKTHHSDYGAYELARMVVAGIHTADPALIGNLAQHLAADVQTFNPHNPDPPESHF